MLSLATKSWRTTARGSVRGGPGRRSRVTPVTRHSTVGEIAAIVSQALEVEFVRFRRAVDRD